MSAGLTPKQQAFVAEYLLDLNGTAAAIRAGYSERTAKAKACTLLAIPKVVEAIMRAKAARAERVGIEADDVVRELSRIAFLDPRDVLGWGPGGVKLKPSADLTPEAAAAVAEISEVAGKYGTALRVKFHSKTAALDMLAKHVGLYGDGGTNIAIAGEQQLLVFDGGPDVARAALASLERMRGGGEDSGQRS